MNESQKDPSGPPVAVYEAADIEEALALRATLEAEGFTVFLPADGVDPVLGGLHPSASELAPLTLYVPSAQAEEARARITALNSGENALKEEDDS